jgi:hypothetical protein
MGASKTSLSAGEIIRSVLVGDADVSARVRKVFPVVEDSAELPYIVYRRVSLEGISAKGPMGPDTVGVEIRCHTAHYTEGVELAEAVRQALDGAQAEAGGLKMRSCTLADSEETWQDDAYIQQLLFNVKIR